MDQPSGSDRTTAAETTGTEQLRTISFRLRGIRRLLAMRVEQENRRLEADDLEPVTDTDRFTAHGDGVAGSAGRPPTSATASERGAVHKLSGVSCRRR